jgi:two-component system, LytTR family, response regulator
MKPFTAIIIDDEPEARDLLYGLINDQIPEVKIIAQAGSADEGISHIISHEPDIVFLDIDMPGKNGFEVARSISEQGIDTRIVFITAYNQYAIEAFKVAAFDYLLKPVAVNDLKSCISRMGSTKKIETLQQSLNKLLNKLNNEKICIPGPNGYMYIAPEDIAYCEAEGNYTDIYLDNGNRHTISLGLGKIEMLLDGFGFARISRSVLINKKYLCRINRKEKKCILKICDNEIPLDIKQTYFKKWL